MPTIFPAARPDGSTPQTHALVVGVNDYPHLLNGSLHDEEPAAATMGLRQLTSPVVSAAAVADWLTTGYINPDVPLGSIELLLSPPPAGTAAGDGATMENIKTGFDAWFGRCDQSPDNIALFYFCGHGLDAEVLVLLASDFGKSRSRLWENSIDFNGTFDAMGECRAKTQCYFIDACRSTPIELLRQRGRVAAQPLRSPTTLSFPPRDAPVYLATPFGQKAGPANGVSFFTAALLACLGRLGAARRVGTDWVVTTASLRTALPVLMGRTHNGQNQRLHCDVGRGVGPSADGPALLAGHRVRPHRRRLPADGRPEIRPPELDRGPGVVAPPARPEPRPVGAGAGR